MIEYSACEINLIISTNNYSLMLQDRNNGENSFLSINATFLYLNNTRDWCKELDKVHLWSLDLTMNAF